MRCYKLLSKCNNIIIEQLYFVDEEYTKSLNSLKRNVVVFCRGNRLKVGFSSSYRSQSCILRDLRRQTKLYFIYEDL